MPESGAIRMSLRRETRWDFCDEKKTVQHQRSISECCTAIDLDIRDRQCSVKYRQLGSASAEERLTKILTTFSHDEGRC